MAQYDGRCLTTHLWRPWPVNCQVVCLVAPPVELAQKSSVRLYVWPLYVEFPQLYGQVAPNLTEA